MMQQLTIRQGWMLAFKRPEDSATWKVEDKVQYFWECCKRLDALIKEMKGSMNINITTRLQYTGSVHIEGDEEACLNLKQRVEELGLAAMDKDPVAAPPEAPS